MTLEHTLSYYVYISTNELRSELVTNVTGDIEGKAKEISDSVFITQRQRTCLYIVYLERHVSPECALLREREISSYTKKRKKAMIDKFNPEWKFLNEEIVRTVVAANI